MSNSLKYYRKRKKLTQKKLAEMVGVTERNYQSYEYGKVIPNVYTALRISKALEKPVDYLFMLDD